MTPKRHLYLAGPMAGLHLFNAPHFNAVAKRLRDVGYLVTNPAEVTDYGDLPPVDLAEPETFTEAHRHRAMTVGLRALVGYQHWGATDWDSWEEDPADGVAYLSGWERSRGALLEVSVAQAIGLPVHHWQRWFADALAARP